MSSYVDYVCVNSVFYADNLCLMASCAFALRQLIHVCHRYSIIVDLHFNALKHFCSTFTPRPQKLCLEHVHIINLPLVYVDSIK